MEHLPNGIPINFFVGLRVVVLALLNHRLLDPVTTEADRIVVVQIELDLLLHVGSEQCVRVGVSLTLDLILLL